MIKFKKVLSFFVLNVFVFLNAWISNLLADYNTKSLILAKSELSKIKKWDYYIKTIDSLVDQLEKSNDKEKLERLYKKLYDMKYKLEYSTTSEWKSLYSLINYFYIKVQVAINNIYDEEYSDLQDEYDKNIQILSDLKDEKLLEYKNNTLPESERNLVESKLVDIQLNLFEKWTNYLDNIIKDFDKITSLEEKWDFKMSFNLNENEFDDTFTKINSQLKFSDYTSKSSNFDSQLMWKLEAILNASTKWEDDIKLEINSMIDFISKDWNMYLLIEKLNIISEEWIEEIKDYVDELKEISSQNKYIKFQDLETTELLNMISEFNPEKIIWDWKTTLSKPMFEPYKKDWDKYYLIPTKYACDKVKEFMNKFDPFNWDTCSDSQYERLLSDFAETWNLYIILWNNSKLWFEVEEKTWMDKFDWYVVFSDKNIEELNLQIEPNQDRFPWEGLYASYKRNDYINSNFFADGWDMSYTFKSKLDKNNNFQDIDFDLAFNFYRETIKSNLTLKNKIINWDLSISSKSYNYDTWEYVDSNELVFILSWNTDYNNEINSLNLTYNWIDLETNKDYLKWSFKYNNNNYTFENHILSTDFNSDISFDWSWDANNKVIKKWDLEIIFDFDNYYNGEKYKFQNNLSLNNTVLLWKSYFYVDDKKVIEIDHNWVYKKDYLEFNNNFESNKLYSLVAWDSAEARDSKRITDLQELNFTVNDFYYDNAEYPSIDKIQDAIDTYSYYSLSDPLWNVEIDWCKFWYTYEVWPDEYWNENWKYRLSTCLEWDSNKTSNDWWIDDNKYEIWKDIWKDDFWKIVYINWYTSWEKRELIEEVIPVLSWNLNFKIDWTNNKGDFNFYVDLSSDNKKIFDFEVDNKSVRTYKDIEIKAPTNYIDSSEVFPTNNYYLY